MLRALALLLAGCSGEAFLQCPSPFALMQTETECFDARPALDIVWAAGIQLDPSTVRLTVVDTAEWNTATSGGEVQGLTDQLNVYVSRNAWPLAHELLHVSERPHLTNHEQWGANGFYALVNLDSYVQTGEASVWGWQVKPCRGPAMPAEMADKLRAAGYPVDAAQADAARVCE